MRVLYDGSLSPEPKSGIERYFSMLATHLPEDTQLSCSLNSSRKGILLGSHKVSAPPFPLFRPRKLAGFLNMLIWLGKTFDLVHWMHYGPSQVARRLCQIGIPYVVTVHDLIHEIYGAPPGLLDRAARQTSYDKASAILCVSSNTKKDLLQEYHVDPSKVRVVHHGSSIQPSEINNSLFNEERYFLFVGARSGYKNFSALYSELKAVVDIHSDVTLRIVGSPLTNEEKSESQKYGLNGMIIEEGRVDDARLTQLYSGCVGLLHPSLHEGFGIPLVEAMTCGAVPIATYSTSVPEVLGDAGVHVDPEKINPGFRDAMFQLLTDPQFRRRKVQESLSRSKEFSWQTAARQTMEAYEFALQ